jgi:SNF2-related domain
LELFEHQALKTLTFTRAVDATEEHTAEGEKRRRELFKLIQPVYKSRTKLEVLKDMPTKTEHVVLCELSELQKKVSGAVCLVLRCWQLFHMPNFLASLFQRSSATNTSDHCQTFSLFEQRMLHATAELTETTSSTIRT